MPKINQEEYEGEETEVKNINDVIEKVERNINVEGRPDNEKALMRLIINDLEKLDEPEVLSQKWIDKNKTSIDRKLDGTPIYKVREELLQNLLVPKQEITEDQAWDKIAEYYQAERVGLQNSFEYLYYGGFMTDAVVEKPVIPKFVAEYLDFAKSDTTLMRVFDIANNFREMDKWNKEYNWIRSNSNLFARTWLDGYEVEKEKLYTIEFPQAEGVFARYTGDEFREWEIMDELVIIGNSDWQYKFTEAEIKAIDERYWAFSEEVTE